MMAANLPLRIDEEMRRPIPIMKPLPDRKVVIECDRIADTQFTHRVAHIARILLERKFRRMHVYTPPGYETGSQKYSIFYLLHGAGDSDDSWTSVGRAGLIMDNLIATGKTKLMIVVMPNTSKCASGIPSAPGKDDACTQEYLKDIIPYVEGHYRAKADRADRAIAGLSMGGFVVMNTGLPHLDTFSELFVYSSGYFPDQIKAFEDNFQGMLKDPATNDLLRVPFYMSAGETDIALKNGQAVMAILNKNGVRNFWVLSSGGHEWANWRRSLYQTAQIMFPECGGK